MGENKIIPPGTAPALTSHRRCSGCGRCVAACPEKLYTLELSDHRKHALNSGIDKCCRCGNCISACPLEIISAQTVSL